MQKTLVLATNGPFFSATREPGLLGCTLQVTLGLLILSIGFCHTRQGGYTEIRISKEGSSSKASTLRWEA